MGGDRRECLIMDLAAESCRSPVDTGVATRGPQFVQRIELRADPRVNRAQQWFGVGVRVPPSLEGGCEADKGFYLSLEMFPEFGSRAGCHPLSSPPPSSRANVTRARLFFGNVSPAELRQGPA